MKNRWFEGDIEVCDACVLCVHGRETPDGDDRHNRISDAAGQPIEYMASCSGCRMRGRTGQQMPDDDPARDWMDAV